MAAVEEVMPDDIYDLVGVLYHSLREAQNCEQYAEDARGRDDDELAEFFADVRQLDMELAERAEALLAARLAEMYEFGEE
jgi:hypothetical protein